MVEVRLRSSPEGASLFHYPRDLLATPFARGAPQKAFPLRGRTRVRSSPYLLGGRVFLRARPDHRGGFRVGILRKGGIVF